MVCRSTPRARSRRGPCSPLCSPRKRWIGVRASRFRAAPHAHYEHGQHVVREATLREVAAEIGLDAAAFAAALKNVAVDEHVAASQELMNNVGAQGFPTFVLQIGEDWFAVPHGRFASTPAKFAEWLDAQLRAQSRTH